MRSRHIVLGRAPGVGCISSTGNYWGLGWSLRPLTPMIYQSRQRSWYNPLSKFNTKGTMQLIQSKTSKPSIEVPETSNTQNSLEELKHLLREPGKLKVKNQKLANKFNTYIQHTHTISSAEIEILDKIFGEIQTSIRKQRAHILDYYPIETLIKLFELTCTSILEQDNIQNQIEIQTNKQVKRPQFKLPKYMVMLIEIFSKSDINKIPMRIFSKIIDLGATLRDLETVIYSLIISKKDEISPEFTNELLNYYQNEKKIANDVREKTVMDIFEILLSSSIKIPSANILGDSYYTQFIQFIEFLFQESAPTTHPYKSLERSIDRIQYMTWQMLSTIKPDISNKIKIELISFAIELLSANNDIKLKNTVLTVLNQLMNNSRNQNHDIIKDAIFQQDLENESVCENILYTCWSNDQFSDLSTQLSEFIMMNDVKFSVTMRLQANIYKILHSDLPEDIDMSEAIIYAVEDATTNQLNELDMNHIYTKIMKCISTSIVSPNSETVHAITKYFRSQHHIEFSAESFKFRIDKSIQTKDCQEALDIFDESQIYTIQWHSDSNPAIFKTLNDLIILVCEHYDNISDIFPIFTRIKQHIPGTCNIEAITALSNKMLQAEFIGDLIEMLKRELPTIDKYSSIRLPIEKPYGIKYLHLFKQLHEFAITYCNEETFETNWVIYGEIQRYFNIPYKDYLPAIEFFCNKGRFNAALLIFRRIRQKSEMFDHLPPSREIYMYLFKIFGDNLYEEGINELYSYLNLDTKLDTQDIQLQNSILNAFANLQDVARARDLFLTMTSNPKQYGGVNEETAQIMIKAYTYRDLAYVQRFWNNLSQFEIIPNHDMYKQYLIAHVYHGYVDETFELIEEMDDYDLLMTTDILIALNNFCFEEAGQRKLSNWAESNYPKLWQEAVNSGLLTGASNYMPSHNLIAGQTD
ncbi:uncharacterized protein RJT21DRAFT_123326 [Scheffersomyces amazonensis]|uniref:uncharacterized protein n=1 Tax=Scheffersomyces amazonensis TaxID=1078765 RepID=UPI00315D5304